tara:strand:+ start:1297 stop:1557 length:261 start_codon:yes stop_codon:yes gene_type:complete
MTDKFHLTVLHSMLDNGGWGDSMYVVGLFDTERKAVLAGALEEHRRANMPYGGKYKSKVIPMIVNSFRSPIDIQAIEDMYYQSSAG